MAVAVLDGHDSMDSYVNPELFQMIDGDVFEIKECKETNSFAHVTVCGSFSLSFFSAFVRIDHRRPHHAHHIKILLVLSQLGDVESVPIDGFRVEALETAVGALAASTQLFGDLLTGCLERRLRIIFVEL